MRIETDRLVLRPMRLSDLDGLAALLQDDRVHPWVREDGAPTRDETRRWIARKVLAWAEGTEAAWTVLRDGEPVGYVTLHGLDRPVQALSYAISPDHWRLGFAREALGAVLARCAELGVTDVRARTHHENPPSSALLLALGFVEREPIAEPPRREFGWSG